MKHRLGDFDVVDPGAVSEHYAGDVVTAFGVVRHSAARLVEDVSGMGSYGKQSQGFGHDRLLQDRLVRAV